MTSIMIVDDHPMVREGLAAMLESERDFSVAALAATGEEAVAIAGVAKPDVVLSDIRIVFSSASKAEAFPRRLKNLYRDGVLEVAGRVPAGVGEVVFSLEGLNGSNAYEGFFRLKLDTAETDPKATTAWREEQAIDVRLR